MSKFYEFTGKVVSVGKTETFGKKDPSKPFYKRIIVVDDSGVGDKYSNPVPFEATGDKCALLESCKKGNEVTIKFALNGREWTDRQGAVRTICSNRILAITKAQKEVKLPMKDAEEFDDLDSMPNDIPF